MRSQLVCATLLLLGISALPVSAADAPGSPQPAWVYPQQRQLEGYTLLMHEPQIRSWPKFESFEALMAFELSPADGSATRFGTLSFVGSTEVDLDERIVRVEALRLDDVQFTGTVPDAYVSAVQRSIRSSTLDIPLDIFLSYLADAVLESPPPAGFNTAPPPIHAAKQPTILLFVNGDPVLVDSEGGLQIIANANWPTFYDAKSKTYYLLNDTQWLFSKKLNGTWKATTKLPAGFEQLAADGEHAAVRAQVPPKPSTQPVPRVILTENPAELIVTAGEPALAEIPGTDGLMDVTNTESPLFKINKTWYYLVAGRWFTTTNLQRGPWQYSAELPSQFSEIPDDAPDAAVLASVPGTVESRMAALEALLPTKVTAPIDGKPPIEVSYAGDPKFETITGTELSRAVNSGYDIIQYEGHYYLCYAGIWYDAISPVGPWTVATDVPAAVYTIPPSSPAYNVTQVKVVQTTPTTVVYSYPPAYTSSVYVVYGVPYYGTGWYYPPYIYGPIYYPYWGSYGHGSWYNPATGGYGSRSVWYGPYGGYSYTQGYNPYTNRYGYVQTAWDNDDWMSYGEKFNPRTGVYTETGRHYNADTGQLHTERTRVKGDQWATMDRTVDRASGTSEVRRQTSAGGSSQVNRQLQDGTLKSDGTVTAGDGRTATIDGEHTIGQGGTTKITGSEGGQAISKSGGGDGRTTLAQGSNGDLYAGHNGSVYKKTDDGWSHYDGDGWQNVDKPARPGAATNPQVADYSKQLDAARSQSQRDAAGAQSNRTRQTSSRDMSQLNRDYSARQRGNHQFQQRSAGNRQRTGGGMGGGTRGGGRRR